MAVLDPLIVQQKLVPNPDLEDWLQRTYRRKLKLQVLDYGEVHFVQQGVEYIVHTLVDAFIMNRHRLFNFMGDPDICRHISVKSEHVLFKVGSFYERTKNTYPDEFDFVYTPLYVDRDKSFVDDSFLDLSVMDLKSVVANLRKSRTLVYRDNSYGNISFVRYEGQHGPASTFTFRFERSDKVIKSKRSHFKMITVDLVPGIRVYDSNLANRVMELCPFPGFQELIAMTGKYFWIPYSFNAFNETEVYFMRHVLSRKHVKAYRLLKYILNGDGDGEELKRCCDESDLHIKCLIPSYAIKTAMIVHHYSCQDGSACMGECIIQILKWFENRFTQMQTKKKDNHEYYHVDITAPSNKLVTLATSSEDFINSARQELESVITYLQGYRGQTHLLM